MKVKRGGWFEMTSRINWSPLFRALEMLWLGLIDPIPAWYGADLRVKS